MMNRLTRTLIGLAISCLAATAAAECSQQLKPTFDITRAQVLGDGTLVDTATGLMWARCSLGQTWQDGSCVEDSASASEYTWAEALVAADAASVAGHDDWRLPNVNELESIVERACFNPSINAELFPGTASLAYWTNTPNNVNAGYAWAVNFTNGDHISTSGASLFGARLVRSVK